MPCFMKGVSAIHLKILARKRFQVTSGSQGVLLFTPQQDTAVGGVVLQLILLQMEFPINLSTRNVTIIIVTVDRVPSTGDFLNMKQTDWRQL